LAILTDTGKRNRTRVVPLKTDVVDLVARHGKEFLEEDKQSHDNESLPLTQTAGSGGAALEKRAGRDWCLVLGQ